MSLARKKLRFIDLHRERKVHRDRDDELTKEIEELRRELTPEFEAEGAKNWPLEDGTIYSRFQVFASIEDPEATLAAAKEGEFHDLINEEVDKRKLSQIAKEEWERLSRKKQDALIREIKELTGLDEGVLALAFVQMLPKELREHVTFSVRNLLIARPK